MAEKLLILVDGYSLLYRAFFATRYLSTTDGRPTNALFGFTSMLFSLLENEKPDYVIVALDAPGDTFRHESFAEYKGTRKETPEELIQQLIVARELIRSMNIPTVELASYEADDIIGTLCNKAASQGIRVHIVTGDLDSLQLVNDLVTVVTTQRGVSDVVRYDPAAVEERYGFGPELIPDYKAFVGDASDNIPGVPGIGAKSATYLLQTYGSVEQILDRLDEVEEKFRKKIEPNQDQLKKSKWLATINREVPIETEFQLYRLNNENLIQTKSILESYELRSALKRADVALGRYVEGGVSIDSVSVESESIRAELSPTPSIEALRELMALRPFSLFVSTHSQPTLLESESSSASQRGAFLCTGKQVYAVDGLVLEDALSTFSSNLIGWNLKPLFRRLPGAVTAPRFDAALAGYVLQSGRSDYALRDLIQSYLEITPPADEPSIAMALFQLEKPMRERAEKEEQTFILDQVEIPLIPILAKMERAGIMVKSEFLHEFSQFLDQRIEQIAATIYEMAREEFNIGSPKQLGQILFEKLGLPAMGKTKTGYTTGAEVLQQLGAEYPIASEIIAYRELSKLKGTYADSLPKLVGEDGRIHTTFNQTVAATGRLSSNDPNLQNIPIRTEIGRSIRRAFVAPEGMKLLSLDYSQIELRILAHLSREPALVEAFETGADVHSATAALMFGEQLQDVTKEQRNYAKLLNYAVLYGVTDYGLANQLGPGFGRNEARALIDQYNERFPGVRAYMDSVIKEARSKGYTTTLCGRRRYFPDIHNQNRNERMYAERQAMNAPIQGTAADMIKLAMIEADALLKGRNSRMILQVHDELLIEWDPEEEEVVELIRTAMEKALELSVPVLVDAKAGENWLEMEPLPRPQS